VLLSILLQDILNPSHHLLNVFLQIANKLGIKKMQQLGKRVSAAIDTHATMERLLEVVFPMRSMPGKYSESQ
jgi:hypothetical protein